MKLHMLAKVRKIDQQTAPTWHEGSFSFPPLCKQIKCYYVRTAKNKLE